MPAPLTAETIARIFEAKQRGLSSRQIAAEIGVSRSVAARVCTNEHRVASEMRRGTDMELVTDREALPAGHPVSWGAVLENTPVLAAMEF